MVTNKEISVLLDKKEAHMVNERQEMEIELNIKIRFNMPQQTKNIPNEMEEIVEEVGQQSKRELYKVVMEKADEELVSARKQTAAFNRIGTKPYTIKAVFGKVIINRIRIRDKTKGWSQIPSAHAWETGQQAYTTKGLKGAICDLGGVKRLASSGLVPGRLNLIILIKHSKVNHQFDW